jgi:hypothetical protein
MSKLANIIEAESVTTKLLEYENQNEEFDNLWFGVTWRMAREPYCGYNIKDNIYFIKTNKHINLTLKLLYRIIDESNIEILEIDIVHEVPF